MATRIPLKFQATEYDPDGSANGVNLGIEEFPGDETIPLANIPDLPTSRVTDFSSAVALLIAGASLNPANVSQSATYRFTTDAEKATWNAKQTALGFTAENAANKATDFTVSNNTKYPSVQATKTYVDAAITNLIGTAPANLDTLQEIAAQFASDESIAAALTTTVAGKQPLNTNLTAISALAPVADDFLQFKSGAWTKRTIAQVKTDLNYATIASSGSYTDLLNLPDLALKADLAGANFSGAVAVINSTAATAGTPVQSSPKFSLEGAIWRTDTLVSQASKIRFGVVPSYTNSASYNSPTLAVDFYNGSSWISAFGYGQVASDYLFSELVLKNPGNPSWGGKLQTYYNGAFLFKHLDDTYGDIAVRSVGQNPLNLYQNIWFNGAYNPEIRAYFNGKILFAAGRPTWYDANNTGNSGSEYVQSDLRFGIGTTALPAAQLHVIKTTEQLRLGYDATNRASFTVDSTGNLTVAPTGSLLVAGKAIQPATLTDSAAPNNSIFYSSTQSKLCYKNDSSVVNPLY